VMDGTVIAALITGPLSFAGGIVAIILTQRGSKKRDQEADWRKMKLEYYGRFVTALSEATTRSSNRTLEEGAQRLRVEMGNLQLIAPTEVLIALNALIDAIYSQGPNKDPLKFEKQVETLRSSLMRAMRKDCHPKLKPPSDSPDLIFGIPVNPPDRAKILTN